MPPDRTHSAWLTSRTLPRQKGVYIMPGGQRALTVRNFQLAYTILHECAYDLLLTLWGLHPIRTTLMMCLNVLRGVLPAFRGYSQAMIIDELQTLVASGTFTWTRVLRLMVVEILRRALESFLETFASNNESIVHNSARFFAEYQQMEQRLRLDIPALADPAVHDLLHESDLFVRSFSGMGGFGLLSPFDVVHVLALLSELISHVWILVALTGGAAHIGALSVSLLSALLPLLLKWLGVANGIPESKTSRQGARTAQRQEKLRGLAYSEVHRPEVIMFGLGPRILRSWASARKAMLRAEHVASLSEVGVPYVLSQINVSDALFALQNIPLVMILQSSSTSLGSLALYRSSIEAVVFTLTNLLTTTRMAFQGIFLMGAFCAAMKIQPRLKPHAEKTVKFQCLPNGVRIEARDICYTYPGNTDPALKNVSFVLEAGQTLAIVGYNGSGKSTLAKILLRILDFESGSLCMNDVDARRFDPDDFHTHCMCVFQGFAKYNSTLRENVGVGNIQRLGSPGAVHRAIGLAGAESVVEGLPDGYKTKLDASGAGFAGLPSFTSHAEGSKVRTPHGLSGGEWQRIAISRAFMRADQPDVGLIVFDEPTSSLDSHAQNKVFDTIEEISRSPSGERSKTVIFITHRLPTARRADKVAMMENGSIIEFGSHQDLLLADGQYAALYRASV
ncbi:P-loop containing nucleoside triphosphate hydrolase protein [Athelia psychrophila]|uniref:P-loop containing nucleoside triphosphate hydrolase protein n=1 Tax=Athelia psychrophila TaxID=1759441 RepID=A0A166BWQ5_9AGAM|nr:P-loop containing nucleoside triphosphate hydrolase protein [Fibularhizoctonia sp. CBS 109695]